MPFLAIFERIIEIKRIAVICFLCFVR